MPRELLQHDIIGQRLESILARYELLEDDGGWDHKPTWFVLENNVAFQLPDWHNEPLVNATIPADAELIDDPAVAAVLGSQIDRLVRPPNSRPIIPGSVC